MKLWSAAGAPNPRRVEIYLMEKGEKNGLMENTMKVNMFMEFNMDTEYLESEVEICNIFI